MYAILAIGGRKLNEDQKNRGLFKLPESIRTQVLANIGLSEEEYLEKLRSQIERERLHCEAEARGEIVHGWSTKLERPGWCDDHIVGEVTLPDRKC
jgi:hypothetical protein